MSSPVKNTSSIATKANAKALVKTGLRRGLGLLILFFTVTASSCSELLSPLFKLFS